MGHIRKFTSEEIDVIKKDFESGLQYKEIAEKLCRPESSIAGKILKLGLRRREHSQKSLIEIANKVGKSSSFFYVIKSSNYKKFKMIRRLGKGELDKGYLKYVDIFEYILLKVQDIYFSYEKTYHFAKELADNGLYANAISASNSIEYIFNTRNTHSYKQLKILHKIFKKFRYRLQKELTLD